MLRAKLLTGALSRATKSSPRTGFQGASLTVLRAMSSEHGGSETPEAFTERYVQFFDGVDDLFELQRGLNNCFAYDQVPSPAIVEAALKAARRVNDYPTAVRIFEGIKEKVENERQYKAYLDELKPVKDSLGVLTKEELGY